MAKRPVADVKVAVAYIRVSTEDQRLGPEAQRAAVEAWAASTGVTIVAWFEDLGVSGAAPIEDRPGLIEALSALRTRGAGVLVVAKRDRLARDPYVALTIERVAGQSGAIVASADGAGNGDSPSDVLMRRMLDAFGEHERALIRARTKAALGAKRARGEKLGGGVPYGYSSEAGRLVPLDSEQTTISEARRLAAGGATLRAVAASLASSGRLSRSGRPFAAVQVARMLAPREAPGALLKVCSAG